MLQLKSLRSFLRSLTPQRSGFQLDLLLCRLRGIKPRSSTKGNPLRTPILIIFDPRSKLTGYLIRIKIRRVHFFYLFLLGFYAFLLARPIDLTTQDIGRHIANGRELVAGNFSVLFKNYYSFTDPNHPFVNHHWLFGLIFFGIEQFFGFVGVHLIHILILLSAFLILLQIFKNNSSQLISFALALPALFFLALRSEVRPESIGFLFLVNSLWQLQKIINQQKIAKSALILLIVQQLIWVNIHISFVFGLFTPALLWGCSVLLHSPQLKAAINKKLLLLIVCLFFASLVNPNFIAGLLQPFQIFTDYGYSVFENQTLFFLWRVVKHTTLFPYSFAIIIMIALLIAKGKVLNKFDLILCIIGMIMGYVALRNIPIFIVFTFPSMAKLLASIVQQKNFLGHLIRIEPQQKIFIMGQLYLFIFILTLAGVFIPYVSMNNRTIGLLPGQNHAAEFISRNNITGPIFNNYDIGSYLIYHQPNLKVFTDNRPEAYGKQFFQETYIPMQLKPEIWQEQIEKQQLQTIIFGTKDITNWAQTFLKYLKTDPSWSLIYQDSFISIWTRHQL